MKNRIGYLYIAITALLFGSSPVIFKLLSGFTSSNVQNFFRTLVASILLTLYTKITLCNQISNTEPAKKVGFKQFIIPALLFYGFIQLYILGIQLSKANLSSFIMNGLGPVINIIVLSIFIVEERVHLKNKFIGVAIIFGLIGAAMTMLNSNNISKISIDAGLVLVVFASIFWALYATYFKKYISAISPIICLRNIMLLSCGFFFITIIFTEEIFSLPSFSINLVVSLIVAGFLLDVLANVTFFAGMAKISGVKASAFLLSVPIITLFISGIALKETLTLQQFLGGMLTLSGNALLIYSEFGIKK